MLELVIFIFSGNIKINQLCVSFKVVKHISKNIETEIQHSHV